MKIISASDLHIHDDSRIYWIKLLCREIEYENPDLLILNGDIGDPWETTWEEILKTQSWKELYKLCLERTPKQNIWINYNHDYSAKEEYLPAELHNNYRVDDILFMHGYEVDVSWSGVGKIPGIASVAFWLSRNYPEQAIKIWDFLRKITFSKTPFELKGKGLEDEWNYHISVMHMRAVHYAIKNKLRIVMGHTHCPVADLYGKVTDGGDMVDSFTYVCIQNGDIELRYL